MLDMPDQMSVILHRADRSRQDQDFPASLDRLCSASTQSCQIADFITNKHRWFNLHWQDCLQCFWNRVFKSRIFIFYILRLLEILFATLFTFEMWHNSELIGLWKWTFLNFNIKLFRAQNFICQNKEKEILICFSICFLNTDKLNCYFRK